MKFERGKDPKETMNIGHKRDTIKILRVWFRQQSGTFFYAGTDAALERLHKLCNTREVIPIHELNLYFMIENRVGIKTSLGTLQGNRILFEGIVFELPILWKNL